MARGYQDYAEKVVVITGASAGIGAALAEEIARRGGKLVLVARRREKLDEVARKVGEAEVVVGDVTRREDVQRALDAAVARFGHVDIWVNNAGRGISKPLLALTDEDVDTVFRDNLKSVLYGMQAVLPHFQARNAGVLVNVSSMLSRVPFAPIRAAYSAAKAAVDSLTETARIELAKDHPGVRVVLVLPGVVATDFGLNALGGGPDSRALPNAQDVDEVARVVADGIMAGRSDVYTRAEGLDVVLGHLRALASTPRPH
jgi:NAD(P)-dependent dehydrogenase (short-subunit alcohol dehydrogenase family)